MDAYEKAQRDAVAHNRALELLVARHVKELAELKEQWHRYNPPVGTRCLARETPTWVDHDLESGLRELTGDEPVELQQVGVKDSPNLDADDVRRFRELYTAEGPWAAGILWAEQGGKHPLLITGVTRSAGAYRAGLSWLPAWVLLDDDPQTAGPSEADLRRAEEYEREHGDQRHVHLGGQAWRNATKENDA